MVDSANHIRTKFRSEAIQKKEISFLKKCIAMFLFNKLNMLKVHIIIKAYTLQILSKTFKDSKPRKWIRWKWPTCRCNQLAKWACSLKDNRWNWHQVHINSLTNTDHPKTMCLNKQVILIYQASPGKMRQLQMNHQLTFTPSSKSMLEAWIIREACKQPTSDLSMWALKLKECFQTTIVVTHLIKMLISAKSKNLKL